MKPRTLVMILVGVGFVGFLLWSTLSAQQAECHACVTFNGQTNCASASAMTPEEASRQAVATACGTIAKGMDESIRCTNMPPERPRCTTR